MFDLNEAIRQWRRELAQREVCEAPDLEELENHLREEVEHLTLAGLSVDEAFCLARRRLGDTASLAGELGKVHTATVWKHRLFWMAVGVLGFLLIDHVTSILSEACVMAAAFEGLTGHSLTFVGAATRVLLVGAIVLVLVQGFRQSAFGSRLRRLVGTRLGRTLFLAGCVVLFVALHLARTLTYYYVVPRIGDVHSFGRVAYSTAVVSLGWSLLLPLLVAVLIVKLRPRLERN